MYKLLRSLLFRLNAERSHQLALVGLKLVHLVPGVGLIMRALFRHDDPVLATKVMGLDFPNPVGLAAGLDKNVNCVRPLLDLGFGHIEVGTVTPRPQPGNAKTRLFRLPAHGALINRMGFPSIGVDAFVRRLQRANKHGIVGVNIGKNKATPNDQAVEDYLTCFRAVYANADYVAINISSPNTPQLRALQNRDKLGTLLAALKNEQLMLGKTRRIYVPLAVKVSPDLDDEGIADIAALALEHKIDAIIATNSTVERTGIENELLATEAGGLSGLPLKPRALLVVRTLYNHLQGEIPIIGVGGIASADDAWEMMVAGADLVQVYTGLIYEGPALARRICRGLARRVHGTGATSLAEALAAARSGVHLMR